MEILIFCAVMLIGVVYGYYTVDGSGIAEHPYHDVYGGAPGAFAPAAAIGPRRDRSDRELVARHSLGTPRHTLGPRRRFSRAASPAPSPARLPPPRGCNAPRLARPRFAHVRYAHGRAHQGGWSA